MSGRDDEQKSVGFSPEDFGISSVSPVIPDVDKKADLTPGALGIVTPGAEPAPAEDQGYLSATPGEGWLPSTGKYLATGTIKGLSHIPGMVGDIREGMDAAIAYGTAKVKGTEFGKEYESLQKYRAEHPEEDTLGLQYAPSGADISNYILSKTGEYKPSGAWGRLGMAGIEGATSTISPGGKGKLVEKAIETAKSAFPAATSASASEVVGEETGSPFWSMLTGILTHKASTTVPKAVGAHFMPTDPSERLAGQAIRESATDSEAARRALEIAKQQQVTGGAYLPGFKPELGKITEDPGILAMERRLATDERLAPSGTDAGQTVTETKMATDENANVVQRGAELGAHKISPLTDQEILDGLQNQPTRQASSTAARNIFDTLEETARTNSDELWKDPKLQGATMYTKKTMASINDYLKNLSPSERQAIPKNVMDVIEELNAHPERDLPLTSIQGLRSQVLGAGREAFRKGNNFEGGANNAFARHIGDNVIGDGSNIVFGDKPTMPKVTPPAGTIGPVMPTGSTTAREAWQKAVDATREYHQTFNEGILKKLNQESAAGTRAVSLDSTLDAALSGRNATQNLGLMQKATNGAINDHVADYLMADINGNGTKIVKPKDIDSWLGKGNNKALVDMIPGMEDKLNALRTAGEKQQLASNFRKVANDPEKVVKLFDDNRDAINRLTDPADKAHFEMLENSARRMLKIPTDDRANLETINALANGKTSDLLYGVGTGHIAKSLLGWVAAKGIEAKTGVDLGWLGDVAGALTPQAAGKFGVNKVMEWALSGNVRKKAMELLQKARTDPELAARLMDKPTPETLRQLFGINTIRAPAIGTAEGVDYNDRLSELKEQRAAEDQRREGRATGGKVVSDHDTESDRLVKMVDEVRNDLSSHTEANLNHPDDLVIKALAVANQTV